MSRVSSPRSRRHTEAEASGPNWDPAAASFDVAFSSAPVGMALVDLDGYIMRSNRALGELIGRPQNLAGVPLAALVHSDDIAEQLVQTRRLLQGELAGTSLPQRLRTAGGGEEPAQMHLSVVRDSRGEARHFVVQLAASGERDRLLEQVRHEADHDPLTGLLTRHALGLAISRESSLDKRFGLGGALIVIDIDGFREVNDALGTAVGDDVLRSVGTLMSERLRDSDKIARLDGDEFGLLVGATDADGARKIADELLSAIASRELRFGDGAPVRVSASAGIACFGSGDVADLFAEAEIALREAKGSAGGRAVVFDANMRCRRHDLNRGRSWAEKLRHALATDSFVLDAQPVVTVEDGVVDHHELLLRMIDDDGSLVRPNVFLPVAERFGLMPAIDEWVIRSAIAMVTDPAQVSQPLTVAVNIGRGSVEDPCLLPNVISLLVEHPEAGQYLIFEMTDRDDIEPARCFMNRLSEYGCRFALDDFGSGVASFAALKHLPFDFIKLDGEFTRGLPSSPVDQAIVGAVVEAARSLGRTVIAECVEDEDILAAVAGYDILLAQGLWMGRPARASLSLARA